MTLPAAGTHFTNNLGRIRGGVRFEVAETWYNLFLHTAGRVMTLPYGCSAINSRLPLLFRPDVWNWGNDGNRRAKFVKSYKKTTS